MYASRLAPLLLTLPLAACAGDAEPEMIGEASIALETVPTGVRCIHIDVAGEGHSFSVTPGSSSVDLQLGALPIGAVAFAGTAYDAVCPDAVSPPAGDPSWIADPVVAEIVAGIPERLAFEFRRNEPGEGTADFVDTAISVTPGHSTAFALMVDGTLRGWGTSTNYDFGNNAWSEARTRPAVAAPSLTGVVGVTAAPSRACAWDNTRVWCWGTNTSGQVGDLTLFDRPSPTLAVGSFGAIDEVEISPMFTCLLAADGRAWCWGNNSYGQVGRPTTTTTYSSPQEQSLRYQELSVGGYTACGISLTGTVMCWGYNGSYQLGATQPGWSSNAMTTPMRAAVDVAVSTGHVCAVRADGTVWCWGANGNGQLGNGTISGAPVATPVQVAGVYDAVSVVVTQSTSCALRASGSVSCWGDNSYGGLGDGSGVGSAWPVFARGLSNVVDLKADGNGFTVCATLADGESRCWGSGAFGQIGDGGYANRFVPTKVDF